MNASDAAYWRDLISHGESEKVEFKLRANNDQLIASNLAAFANARGGYLIIGVDDKGKIIGLDDSEVSTTIDRIRRVASSVFSWPVQVGTATLDGRQIVYASVDPAPQHLAPIVLAEGQIFERVGTTARRLSAKEVKEILRGGASEPRAIQEHCRVFVAMSLRQEEEPALVDYDRAIARAIESLQLPIEIVRIDRVEGDYEISQEIMNQIDSCDVVIADFTLSPANVYFELGYARGRKKQIIMTAKKGTQLEFDVRNWRTEFYRNATELEEKIGPAMQAAYAKVTGQE